jgi:hypothetical protein
VTGRIEGRKAVVAGAGQPRHEQIAINGRDAKPEARE